MSRFIHTFTAIYRTQMTEVPSMFGVEKNPAQGAWMNEIDQWRLKVYFWEERKRQGQWWGMGTSTTYPALLVPTLPMTFELRVHLSIERLMPETHNRINRPGNQHFETKERQILRTSRSIYGRLCIAANLTIHQPVPVRRCPVRCWIRWESG